MFNDRKLTAAPEAAPESIRIAITDTDIAYATFKYYPVSERYLAVSASINEKNQLRFYFFDLIEKCIQYQFDEPWGTLNSAGDQKEYFVFAQALLNEQFIIISSKGTTIIVDIKERKKIKDTIPDLPKPKDSHLPIFLEQASYPKNTRLLLTLQNLQDSAVLNINPYAIKGSTLISFPETKAVRENIGNIQNTTKTVITRSRYNENTPGQKRMHVLEEYSVDTQTKTATLNKTRAIPIGIHGGISTATAFGPYVAIEAFKDEKLYLYCLNTDTNECVATIADNSPNANVQWLNNGLLLFSDADKKYMLFNPSTNEVKSITESALLANGFKAQFTDSKAGAALEAIQMVDCSSLSEKAEAHIKAVLNPYLLPELQRITTSYLTRSHGFFTPSPPLFHPVFLAPYRLPKELQVKMLELYDTLDPQEPAQRQKKFALEELTKLINDGENPAVACDTVCENYCLAGKDSSALPWLKHQKGNAINELIEEIRQVKIDAGPASQPDAKKLQ